MADKLVSISDPQLLQSGIVKSLHKLQAPLWIDGQNVVFEDGAVRKSPGFIKAFEALDDLPVWGMQDILVGNVPNLCFGDVENLYRYDGTDVTQDGTGYTGGTSREAFQGSAFQDDAFQLTTDPRASLWSMTDWGSWCIATNNIDDPQINKMGGSGFGNLSGTPPTRARIVIRYKTFVVFFNTDLGGQYSEWSDVDDAEEYATGAAGNLYLRDLDSEINAVAPLGDVLAVYSNNSMGIFQYIGPDFWFGFKKVLDGIGATGIFSVVAREGMNYGMSKAGAWETDGAQYNYISPPYIRKWLQDNVNWAFADKIAGLLNEDRSMVEWGVPTGGASDNNLNIGYNYQNRTWTFRNYGITCGIKKNIFSFPVFGNSDGEVFFAEYGLDADTDPLVAWVQSKPLHGDNVLAWKDVEFLISYIRDLEGTGVKLYIGVQENLDDAIQWSNDITASESAAPDFVADQGLAGKYISLKIYSDALGDNWKLAGFDIYGSFTGMDV